MILVNIRAAAPNSYDLYTRYIILEDSTRWTYRHWSIFANTNTLASPQFNSLEHTNCAQAGIPYVLILGRNLPLLLENSYVPTEDPKLRFIFRKLVTKEMFLQILF